MIKEKQPQKSNKTLYFEVIKLLFSSIADKPNPEQAYI